MGETQGKHTYTHISVAVHDLGICQNSVLQNTKLLEIDSISVLVIVFSRCSFVLLLSLVLLVFKCVFGLLLCDFIQIYLSVSC